MGNFHVEFFILCSVLGWLSLRGIIFRQRLFEYPTLAATIGLAWIVPQGIELESKGYNLYSSGSFWIYVCACFVFIAFGFRVGRTSQVRRLAQMPLADPVDYDSRRLVLAAGALVAFGVASTVLTRSVDTSQMGGAWTGVVTLYVLFSRATGLGLCLAALIFARTRLRWALVIAVIAISPMLYTAMTGVRRELLFDVVILTAGSWYVATRRLPSRAAVLACIIVGTIIINNAGILRGYIESQKGSLATAIFSREFYSEFDYFAPNRGPGSEVGMAQYDFWYMNNTGRWEYGASYWNGVVQQYVPAFVFGREFKESAKINTLPMRLQGGEEEGAIVTGSTRTGFSDTYRSFGIFGAFPFLVIGYVFGGLYARLGLGSIRAQYFYLVLLAEGLKAVTHSTASFVSAIPFTVGISLIAFWLARIPPKTQSRSRQRGALRVG